jgi:hypothetical protein
VTRYTESDNRDWKSRAPPPSPVVEDKVKEQPLKEGIKRSDNDWREKEQEPPISYKQPEALYQSKPEVTPSPGVMLGFIFVMTTYTDKCWNFDLN